MALFIDVLAPGVVHAADPARQKADSQQDIVVKVGIISYEENTNRATILRELFRDLSKSGSGRFQPRIALGSYSDVLHWIGRGSVDIAIMPAALLAETSLATGASPGAPQVTYLASVGYPPAKFEGAPDWRQVQGRATYEYTSICLVKAGSQLKSIDDVKAKWDQGMIRFVFVDELSSSGRIIPLLCLWQRQITPSAPDVIYSGSHAQSIKKVLSGDDPQGRELVAFVNDDAISTSDAARVSKVQFDELSKYHIPQEAWVARLGFGQAEKLKQLLLQYKGSAAVGFEDRRQELADMLSYFQYELMPTSGITVRRAGLDDLMWDLAWYKKAYGVPPRLAVVLSGGGAKCAYQVGAIGELEKHMASFPAQDGYRPEISLVVGTSGGALNALPVAMGITQTPQGRQRLESIWQKLAVGDLVRPHWPLRLIVGLWVACIYLGVTRLAASLLSYVRRPNPLWWIAFLLVLPVLVSVALFCFNLISSPWLDQGLHVAVHWAKIFNNFGLLWLTATLAAVAVTLMLQRTSANPIAKPAAWFRGLMIDRTPRGLREYLREHPEQFLPAMGWRLALAVLVLFPVLGILVILVGRPTLFSADPMGRAVVRLYGELLATHVPISPLPSDPAEAMAELSRTMIKNSLLKRDLVITGSLLPPEQPADRYFYYRAPVQSTSRVDAVDQEPAYGKQGVALQNYPQLLLDVVMGSGSIFPLFPWRQLQGFPENKAAKLVDGGFAHNSPIDAAVRWGATHVVLIEASPQSDQRSDRKNLLLNILDALSYLHDQAQSADARSREKVIVYSLRPAPGYPLSVLGFERHRIAAAISAGQTDASTGQFRRVPGEPRFLPEQPER